jgi:hypothetical protein
MLTLKTSGIYIENNNFCKKNFQGQREFFNSAVPVSILIEGGVPILTNRSTETLGL